MQLAACTGSGHLSITYVYLEGRGLLGGELWGAGCTGALTGVGGLSVAGTLRAAAERRVLPERCVLHQLAAPCMSVRVWPLGGARP